MRTGWYVPSARQVGASFALVALTSLLIFQTSSVEGVYGRIAVRLVVLDGQAAAPSRAMGRMLICR